MGRRPGRSRLDQRFSEAAYAPYVKAIGQLALAWNDLHEKFAELFYLMLARQEDEKEPETEEEWKQKLFHDEPDPRPLALWHTAKFDRPKRELLKAAVATISEEWKEAFPKFIDEVMWVLGRADVLEDARNDAVHSPLLYLGHAHQLLGAPGAIPPILPNLILENPRAEKLIKREILTEFRWCRDSTLILRDYIAAMNGSLRFGCILLSWPDRPSLPNRGAKKTPQAGQPRP